MSDSGCGCGSAATKTQQVETASDAELRRSVRETYAASAAGERGFAGDKDLADEHSERLGYDRSELDGLPEGANLGLGCGNPTAIASIQAGETVLDLGSGAGIDCLIASKKAGPDGRVIGVDMTPEMIEKARRNAVAVGAENVEFRLGEIEHLPVADSSVDIVISNCVINLSADKDQVFSEIYRILKPGGRVAVSDTALTGELPSDIASLLEAFVGCVSGALQLDTYASVLQAAGFGEVSVVDGGASFAVVDTPEMSCCSTGPAPAGIGAGDVAKYITSVEVTAIKPVS